MSNANDETNNTPHNARSGRRSSRKPSFSVPRSTNDSMCNDGSRECGEGNPSFSCHGCYASPVSPRAIKHNLSPDTLEKLGNLANICAGRLVSAAHGAVRKGGGVDRLLAYNERWAESIAAQDPEYFPGMMAQQEPEYFYIGCCDSRVAANEILGLMPGEVFVHRNIANVVSPSDLNMLSALQYSVDHLKVTDIIVAGHYRCGGVTAALQDVRLGLADHWVSHVVDVKRRHWARMKKEIPTEHHLNALCELNVIAQIEHLVDTHVVQSIWETQNKEETEGTLTSQEIAIHGWIFSIGDGFIRPLIRITRKDDSQRIITEAENWVFIKHGGGRRL